MTQKTQQIIQRLERELMEAVQHRHMDWLEQHIGHNFTLTTGRPGAEIRTRTDWMRITATQYVIQEFEFEDIHIDAYPQTAVARSRYSQTARMADQDRTLTYLMTDVWIHHPGGWQLESRHITPLQIPTSHQRNPRSDAPV